MDNIDIKIFEKLLENPTKSFLKIAEEIGIAPITAQKRYEKMKKQGILSPCMIIDSSKMGYTVKACFMIRNFSSSNYELTCKFLGQIPNIFLIAEAIGPFDVIALGLFKDLNDVKKVTKRLRDLPSVEKVEISMTDQVDFPFKREYNPLQIFELENVESLIKGQ